jgi:hypothetical protein
VTFVDPCIATSFVDEDLTTVHALVGADSAVLITVPSLTDTTNNMFGSDPSNSICGSQTISLTDSRGSSPDYIIDLEAKTDDLSLMGEHTLDCAISLDNYPSVTTTLSLTLILYGLVAPTTPDDIEYTVNDNKLVFEVY